LVDRGGGDIGAGRHTGLIAQQVQEAMPELVGARQDGFKTVKYHELPVVLLQAIRELKAEKENQEQQTALLLEAVKEQQAQIRELQAELAAVKARLESADTLTLASAKPQG
jgi:multidrug resistance efflux pump